MTFSFGLPGYVWDYYETSLKMSTYLVAMVIADFSYVESNIDSNVTLRVWARHSAINQTKYKRFQFEKSLIVFFIDMTFKYVIQLKRYAVEMGPKILHFFQDYFGIDYP